VIPKIAPMRDGGGAAVSTSSDDAVPVETSALEVRWILPGQVADSTMRWFRRLPVTTETREDTYLLTPWLDGLSVKIRAHAEFDVKAYLGSLGVLEVPGHAAGRLEAWQKWSFPLGVASERADDVRTWKRVRKVRSISWFAMPGGWFAAPTSLDQRAKCAVELTDIVMDGKHWWTLGLEASGPTSQRRSVIGSAAMALFGEAMPDGITLRVEDSGPYATWLRRRRDTT
jgi:hypothetical protein